MNRFLKEYLECMKAIINIFIVAITIVGFFVGFIGAIIIPNVYYLHVLTNNFGILLGGVLYLTTLFFIAPLFYLLISRIMNKL